MIRNRVRWIVMTVAALTGVLGLTLMPGIARAVTGVSHSLPVPNPSDYLSCEFGIFSGPFKPGETAPPLVHAWSVASRGPAGPHEIQLSIAAHQLNYQEERGQIVATLLDGVAVVAGPIIIQHFPTSNGDNVAVLATTVEVLPKTYELRIEAQPDPKAPPPSGTNTPFRTARHYKIGAVQSSVELGTLSQNYFEGRNRFDVHADPGEHVQVVISVDDPSLGGEVPGQASSIDYAVHDSSGAVVVPLTTAAISPASPVTIAFTNSSGSAEAFTITGLNSPPHTNWDKPSGTDHGFYVRQCRAPEPPPPPPPPPCNPGSRTMGFYKNHPDVVLQAFQLVPPPNQTPEQALEQVMKLWDTEPRGDHILILRRAIAVNGMNLRVFLIGGCTLTDLGLEPGDEGAKTVAEIQKQAQDLIRQVTRDGTRDIEAEPLTPEEKEALTAKYEVLDAIANSNTETPLPPPYD